MSSLDMLRFSLTSLGSHRLRTALSMLGIAIGVTAVVLMGSIGEGTRRYVLSQFTQFGTNILVINPGKTETFGIPGVMGGTQHKLTIEDSEALRRVEGVQAIVPLTMGLGRVEAGGRGRSVPINGVTSEVPEVWKFSIGQGSFLPEGDPNRAASVAVLGPRVQRELFGDENPLGAFIRVSGFRMRVIGVMAPKGQLLGFDVDDAVYVPVATAMQIFNQDELMEIDLTFNEGLDPERVAGRVREVLTERHNGREDFTVTTQAAMLEAFDKVLSAITIGLGAIAAISLLVGGIGILTTMWIAVSERTGEIGLLKAVGSTSGQIKRVFLIEAAVLSGIGGGTGLLVGIGLSDLLRALVPGLPIHLPPLLAFTALAVSLMTGLLSGVLPAGRAAALQPLEALHAE